MSRGLIARWEDTERLDAQHEVQMSAWSHDDLRAIIDDAEEEVMSLRMKLSEMDDELGEQEAQLASCAKFMDEQREEIDTLKQILDERLS
jgi:uncharacterized coiled-coil DUF342 family protein